VNQIGTVVALYLEQVRRHLTQLQTVTATYMVKCKLLTLDGSIETLTWSTYIHTLFTPGYAIICEVYTNLEACQNRYGNLMMKTLSQTKYSPNFQMKVRPWTLILTTDFFVSNRDHGWCDRSAEDVYSSVAPDIIQRSLCFTRDWWLFVTYAISWNASVSIWPNGWSISQTRSL
jgi:hypothetical protein